MWSSARLRDLKSLSIFCLTKISILHELVVRVPTVPRFSRSLARLGLAPFGILYIDRAIADFAYHSILLLSQP